MFLQTAQNPTIAPFVKISKLVSELAYSLDLDPDEILNDPEEAAMMAQIIGMQNADKTQARKLNPVVNNPQVWEVLVEYLKDRKMLELQALAVATSESEMFRLQGKIASLVHLEALPQQVKEALNRIGE